MEDEMVGWYHQLNGHEFEQTPGDSERQGSLVCSNSWGHRESGVTEEHCTTAECRISVRDGNTLKKVLKFKYYRWGWNEK